MTDFKQFFENDFCGTQAFLDKVLKPVFGEYEKGYDILTNDSDTKKLARESGIEKIQHAATFDFLDTDLKIYDITVEDSKNLAINKVRIQSIVRKYVDQFEGALIIFHHNQVKDREWRLSYVEKRSSATDSTSAKRYSYILGKNHPARTVCQRFADLEKKGHENLIIADLTQAFSVEPISSAFFEEYRKHYADLVEYISGKRFVKKGGKFVEEKTARAAGAFKEAFGQDDKAVRDYVKKFMGRLVFLQFLQKKGWLGVPQNAQWGEGDKNFIANLYKNASEDIKKDFLEKALEPLFFDSLNNDRTEQNDLAPSSLCNIYGAKIRIPYLNGGLFESDALDTKKVKFKKEDIEALLEFFGRYNFTIDESDSEDTELGVDPEMLGKIFENLLEDNKDKGAFYTPKEIVEYMCRESLIAYLENENSKNLGGGSLPLAPAGKPSSATPSAGDTPATPPSPIRTFVQTRDASAFTSEQKTALLASLCSVKICDPAVGSGAFPMGILTELYALRTALGDAKSPAQIKKEIVKQNIYGVDIEKGAVDIARLRFWLSIIVDEDAANRPQPLPNLDYKIMQGNSLLESFEGIDLSHLTEKEEGSLFDSEDEIQTLLGFLTTYYDTHEEKNAIRDAIKASVLKLLNKRGFSSQKNTLEKLAELDLHQNSQFFLWHTWFNDVFSTKGGFDIVIGNPPYISIRTKSFDTSMKDLFKKNYKLAVGQYDVYILFIELAKTVLSPHGILSYIVPTRLLSNENFEEARKFLLENIPISTYANVSMPFESANVEANIMVCKRKKDKGVSIFSYNVENKKFEYSSFFDYQKIKDLPFSIFPFVFTSDVLNVFEKIQKIPNSPLKDYVEIIRGFECGYKDENIGKGLKKLIKAEAIFPYFINTNEIIPCSPDFSNSKVYKTKDVFEKVPKLVTKFCSSQIKFALDNEGFYNTNSVYNCNPNKNANLSYLLGILNSPITTFWFNVAFMNIDNLFPHIQKNQLESIPIPTATSAQQQKIITLVDSILAAKKQNPSCDTTAQETAIDKEVYALYGLTPTEIATVQGKE